MVPNTVQSNITYGRFDIAFPAEIEHRLSDTICIGSLFLSSGSNVFVLLLQNTFREELVFFEMLDNEDSV